MLKVDFCDTVPLSKHSSNELNDRKIIVVKWFKAEQNYFLSELSSKTYIVP